MITIIGTHHKDFEEHGRGINEVVKLDNFDRIFTEGFSEQGLEKLDEQVEWLVENHPDFRLTDAGKVNRGPEPKIMDSVTSEETDIIYLDDHVTQETLRGIAKYSREKAREAEKYRQTEGEILSFEKAYENHINFLEDLRDQPWSKPDYAALSGELFEYLMDQNAEDLLSNPEQDIEFSEFKQVYGEDRRDFQDQRDQQWYKKINQELEEGENALLITGIKHALDYPGTIRNLLEQEYQTSVTPFH